MAMTTATTTTTTTTMKFEQHTIRQQRRITGNEKKDTKLRRVQNVLWKNIDFSKWFNISARLLALPFRKTGGGEMNPCVGSPCCRMLCYPLAGRWRQREFHAQRQMATRFAFRKTPYLLQLLLYSPNSRELRFVMSHLSLLISLTYT